MSEFDKEAERERLREKYEADQESREATQRMSELLLQGATMTNSHCDTCGDPIFRYDGNEFCPTCQAAGEAATADAEGEESTADAAADADTPVKPSEPSPQADAQGVEQPSQPEPTQRRTAGEQRSDVDERVSGGAASDRTATPDQDSPLATAEASLSRTLVRYAQAAEETDDPRRAKELLAAAREAAETIAALRQ
ncbi:Sjogren's syndrome/scleroderma autoantigen 1 family protein [Haloplanus halobius]|uniref:Sjogren's syndrome/scleroderma autoantigen 1 family protein n=1 Tax=Haloplanus halobius TaxID=2934938 RepID=UPI00200E7845|nr:Sjogren's syndrome/scleroderma autoantigen 1 family protein [Haloplanus sp. XH21]